MRIFTIFIALAIIFGLSGCILPVEEELLPPDLLRPEEIRFITAEVERGSVQDILEDSVLAGSSIHYDLTFQNRSGFLAELEVRPGQEVAAGDVLAKLDTGSLEIDIQRQKIEIEKRELGLEEVRRFGGTRFARRYAELDLELAQLLLQQLEEELEKSTIVAPVDGEVVFLNTFRVGEFVPGRSVVMTIADPRFVQFEYTGIHSGRIKQGMEAQIMVGVKTIPAIVTMIPSNIPIEERDRFRNTVIFSAINPDDVPKGIRIGSRHNFSILIDEKHDVIVIPSSALSTFMGQNYVQVLDNGMRSERDLDIGIMARTHVEVLNGLTEGELLIIGIER